ncbi:MAG: hypothetical protein LUE64_07310 [Candidatus Gastranaerophilales bacterium]|nr:hypothetical protein [Candidatus Gastranaerophilales bacterium]
MIDYLKKHPIYAPDRLLVDMQYHLSAWADFTALTETEKDNLKRLRLKLNPPKPKCDGRHKKRMALIEEYTGITFKSQTEAAQILCVSRCAISQHLMGKIKEIKGLYKFRRLQNAG